MSSITNIIDVGIREFIQEQQNCTCECERCSEGNHPKCTATDSKCNAHLLFKNRCRKKMLQFPLKIKTLLEFDDFPVGKKPSTIPLEFLGKTIDDINTGEKMLLIILKECERWRELISCHGPLRAVLLELM